jgi:hypothetical protein
MHAAPAYLGEVMPPSIRGAVVSGKEVFIVSGMLLGYVIGYGYKGEYRGWKSNIDSINNHGVTIVLYTLFTAMAY